MIRLEQLSKRFGPHLALDSLNLQIERGEIFFLLGPSGCGKTTLLRCLAGFYIPEAGRIFFDSEEVTRQAPHLRKTGMMFQSYALWPHMSVGENVAFGLHEQRVERREIARRVDEVLASVKMAGFGERRIHELSGGQQQRVALARALVIRPRCLLLDEPLSNLDAKLRLEMRGEIRRICKEFGLTAIYVTHDQKEALSIADRMAVLENGRISQVGPPATVYRQPRSRFVADFMGETNFLEAVVTAVETDCLRLSTALGTLTAALPVWSARQGQNCLLSIRPESWVLSATAGPLNSLSGRLGARVYLGEMAQYEFLPAAGSLKIYELNPRFITTDKPLFAAVDPADVIALEPAAGQ